MNSHRMTCRIGLVPAAFLVCAFLANPVQSWAQDRAARIFFVTFEALGPGVPGVVVSQINRDLVQRLDATQNLEVTSRVRTRRETGPQQAQPSQLNAAIDEGEQRYQAGIGLYVVGDYYGATASFQEMVSLFTNNIAEVRNWNMLADGLGRLAECQLRTGDEEAAREILYRLLIIRPDQPFAAETTGQAFAALAEEVRADLARQTAGDLQVDSGIPGAQVFLNGIEVGEAPTSIPGLRPGEHFVVVRNAEGAAVGRRVVVDRHSGAAITLDLSDSGAAAGEETEAADGEPRYLRSLREEIRLDRIGDTMRPYLTELASRQGVDFVLIGVVLAETDGYLAQPFLFRASDGHFAVVESEQFDPELAHVTVNLFSLSQKITSAIRRFPDHLVTGEPLLQQPVQPVVQAPQSAEPEYSLPAETSITVSLATPPVTATPAQPSTPPVESPVEAPQQTDQVFGATQTMGGQVETAPSPVGQPGPAQSPEAAPGSPDLAVPAATVPEPGLLPPPTPTRPATTAQSVPEPSTPVAATPQPAVPDTRITDPVPPDSRRIAAPTPSGQPPAGQGVPPAYGYGYPPPASGQATGQQYGYAPYGYPYPPYGYGYPPPAAAEGEQPAPATGYPPYGYGYPPYGYPPPAAAEGEQPAPATGQQYGYAPYGYPYPPYGYGYPPPAAAEGEQPAPATGYPPPYGYAPPQASSGQAQQPQGVGYSPYGYGYPPQGYPPPATQTGEGRMAASTPQSPSTQTTGPSQVARTEQTPTVTERDQLDHYDEWDDDQGEDKSIFEEWWFWAGSAGLLAVVTTTIIVLTASDSGGDELGGFTPIISW
ncbi:MAG: PEGA domain-containing protein [Bradymonadales bacterium]|nr:PEGA domain-containing protein [Bradymonadales bacterium]